MMYKSIAGLVLSFVIMGFPAMAGCTELLDVTGHLPDLHFALTDDNSHDATQHDYQGEVVLLYFGFTECPDRCPATLSRLARVMRTLGGDASKVHILFVTIDPGHDTPEVLHRYLAALNSTSMTGLTGGEEEIAALAKRYRAAFRLGSLAHSDAIYIFDRQGRARLLGTQGDPEECFINAIQMLQHETP